MAKGIFDKAMEDPLKTIAVIAVIAIVFNLGGARDTVTDWFAPSSQGAAGSTTAPCLHDGATMTIGPMQTMYWPTANTAWQYARVYVNGVDQGLKADGSTLEVSPGDQVEIFYGENGSSGTTNTFQYTAKQKFAVPCRSDFPSGDSTLDNDAYKLYNSTQEDDSNLSSKITCFSQDDGTAITSAATEAITHGDTLTIECRIEGINKEAFSPYAPAALCLEHNSTVYDVLEVRNENSQKMKVISKPVFVKAVSAGKDLTCFEFPSIISNDVINYEIYAEVADSGVSADESVNISQRFFDQDWYRDTVSGEMKMGYEDNDNSDVGTVRLMRDIIDVWFS